MLRWNKYLPDCPGRYHVALDNWRWVSVIAVYYNEQGVLASRDCSSSHEEEEIRYFRNYWWAGPIADPLPPLATNP